MKQLLAALQFLTIIPIRREIPFEPDRMVAWFPVVGLCLGAIVAMADHFMIMFWPTAVASLIDVFLLAWLTGALHLDGLADSADGLYGQRPREKALAIMKDSRVGAMGLVAVVFCILIKWSGITHLHADRFLSILIVPAYARSAMIFGIRALEYGRPSGGTGLEFFRKPLAIRNFPGIALPVILSLFLGTGFILVNTGFVASTIVLILFYKRRMGCITGDMLGAMCECLESVLFILLAMEIGL